VDVAALQAALLEQGVYLRPTAPAALEPVAAAG
jgi:hypothetical protein